MQYFVLGGRDAGPPGEDVHQALMALRPTQRLTTSLDLFVEAGLPSFKGPADGLHKPEGEVMTDITVPVPDDRTAEFYQFFGLWLAGSLSLPGSPAGAMETPGKASETAQPKHIAWGTTAQDHADAVKLWKKYSPRARAVFSLLMDNPGKEFTGGQIAKEANIPNGSHGVAGVLAHPGRHGIKMGRGLPSHWRDDVDANASYYWMDDERADLFKAARAEVEEKA